MTNNKINIGDRVRINGNSWGDFIGLEGEVRRIEFGAIYVFLFTPENGFSEFLTNYLVDDVWMKEGCVRATESILDIVDTITAKTYSIE